MDYVGIDLHKKESHICILSEGGQLSECRIRTEMLARDYRILRQQGNYIARILSEP